VARRFAVTAAALCGAGMVVSALAQGPGQGWKQLSFSPATGSELRVDDRRSIESDGVGLTFLIGFAHDVYPSRVVAPPWVQDTRLAVHAVAETSTPDAFRALLQRAMSKRFKLTAHREPRPVAVYVLKRIAGVQKLEAASGAGSVNVMPGRLEGTQGMGFIARLVEDQIGAPVIDDTGMEGQYALKLSWEPGNIESLQAGIRDQLGLEITPDRRPVEMLIVDQIEAPGDLKR
jgi:uncharacterized protein (TIGR03435 family)